MGKKINALLGGVVAAMALGAAVALNAPKMAVETKAADPSWYLVGSFGGENHWSPATGFLMAEVGTNTFQRKSFPFKVNDEFKVCNDATPGGSDWQGGWSYNNGDSSADIKANCFKADGDGANIVCKKAGFYTVTFTKSDWHIKIEEVEVTSHTVTKYAVLGSTLDDEIYSPEQVVEGNTYSAPTSIALGGWVFDKWYADEACTTPFVSQTINSDLTIYAKYNLSTECDSYFYYVVGSETVPTTHAYTFGGSSQFGAWAGTQITKVGGASEVHGVLAFEGTSQLIYKVPFASSANDTALILNDNGVQTGDMPLHNKYAYWFGQGYTTGSDTAGVAIDFLLKVENLRNAATFGEYTTSVCGIDSATAASLWNEYYAFESGIKDMINNTTTWTYKTDAVEKDNHEETQISYEDIMNQLLVIAIKGGQDVQGGASSAHTQPVTFDNATKNNITLVIIILSVAAITALGAYLFIDKKRSHK